MRQNPTTSLTGVKEFQAGKSPELGWQASLQTILLCPKERKEVRDE
jgi:hypothetical protein